MAREGRGDKCKQLAESTFADADLGGAQRLPRQTRHPLLPVSSSDRDRRFCPKLRMQAGSTGPQLRFVRTATAE
jgi:hypothetical protein